MSDIERIVRFWMLGGPEYEPIIAAIVRDLEAREAKLQATSQQRVDVDGVPVRAAKR